MDYSKFVTGARLGFSQIYAMTIKKFLYSIRNYILLIIQFVIPAFFVIITMLAELGLTGDKDLPELAISFDEYLTTVTTVERGVMSSSIVESIFESYKNIFESKSDSHQLLQATKGFENTILDQYQSSVSDANLNYMIGATFNDNIITAWFNNQGYHTAPLAINTINNAILK